MKIIEALLRPLVHWTRGRVEYSIQRGDLGALLLFARGPGDRIRATSLGRARALFEVPPSTLDKAQRRTTGWRGIPERERTRLAELILKQTRGVLQG